MATYKIYPLKLAEFQQHEKSTLLYLQGAGEKLITPIIAYLIQGEGLNILVDTGCSGPEWAVAHHHPIDPCLQLLHFFRAEQSRLIEDARAFRRPYRADL